MLVFLLDCYYIRKQWKLLEKGTHIPSCGHYLWVFSTEVSKLKAVLTGGEVEQIYEFSVKNDCKSEVY